MPSHVFVHHDDRQASAPAEMTEDTGDEDGQKSSSPVPCNDIQLVHRTHTRQCAVAPTRLYSTASLEGGYETGKLLRKYSKLHKI